eukprot:m.84544 g.84544  ORF g.84544 m.84544 type:complete len:258 (+) comp8349_c0_seq4:78-851(+)
MIRASTSARFSSFSASVIVGQSLRLHWRSVRAGLARLIVVLTKRVLQASMLEIYNEAVVDLLSKDSGAGVKQCQVLSNAQNGENVANLSRHRVENMDDVLSLLQLGDQNRAVAATKMNSQSSRSHLVFVLRVHVVNKLSRAVSRSKLTLVDLAGSERVAKTEAQGARLIEAAAINKSLTALGQVFSGLRNNDPHIPYRNSKLTHLLQDTLGGHAKAMVFLHISPDPGNEQESLSTLQFGKAIRQIAIPSKPDRRRPR